MWGGGVAPREGKIFKKNSPICLRPDRMKPPCWGHRHKRDAGCWMDAGHMPPQWRYVKIRQFGLFFTGHLSQNSDVLFTRKENKFSSAQFNWCQNPMRANPVVYCDVANPVVYCDVANPVVYCDVLYRMYEISKITSRAQSQCTHISLGLRYDTDIFFVAGITPNRCTLLQWKLDIKHLVEYKLRWYVYLTRALSGDLILDVRNPPIQTIRL